MKTPFIFYLPVIVVCFSSCGVKKKVEETPQQKITSELTVIDSLLKNTDYAFEMAKTLDSSYYVGVGQPPPPFLTPGEDTATVIKNLKEEKIATSLAGFYALECSIGVLCAQTGQTPLEWIQKIANKTADSNAVLIVNRFANATWKAGQPFRGLGRITRPAFTCYNFLPEAEVKKDYDQVSAAAFKLLADMQDVRDSSSDTQLNKLRNLMQDQNYAVAMAAHQDSFYYINLHQPVLPFLTAQDDTATIRKSIKDQKIATSIAGFYALECGLNYFVTTRNILPSAMLDSIIHNTIGKDDKVMFSRFANATWKAGQPFRGLNRITKDNFIPAFYLSDEEVEKDIVQIKAAAQKLRRAL